jgi:ribosomal protein S18 acetylase RimI-like enzyme
MGLDDIPAGLDLCRAAGWNQTHRDWTQFLTTTPGGARVARVNGHVVGTAATIRYGRGFAWIGMVLVDPAMRGQGIGTRLLDEAVALLPDVASIRLDATPAGFPLYLTRDLVEEYRIHRMQRAAGGLPVGEHRHVRPLVAADIPEVAALDQAAFGADRAHMLQWMLDGAPDLAWLAGGLDGADGFVLCRRGHAFDHVGPIVARDPAVARALVLAALGATSRAVVLDATLHVPAWREWLASIGFSLQRELIRMARGTPPAAAVERQFAILGPEFG